MIKEKQMIEWCDSQTFYNQVAESIESTATVLDIGCGIRPQQFITPELMICVEPHLEYVEILKKNLAGTNSIIISLEAKQTLSSFPDHSVDSIFLIDVIEHMQKEIGIEVIRECERIARKQIILFTPLGYMPQEVHAGSLDGWNLHGGNFQEHKSGWYPEDFPDWHIIACKHLHTIDHKGNPINPPYGGFYAIKSIATTANYFNEVYAQEMIKNSTNNLVALHNMFPQLIEQVVNRETEKNNLKCGLKSCQKTTEFFIEHGATKSAEEIFTLINQEKAATYLNEARNYISKINDFAMQFFDINRREADIARRKTKLTYRILNKIYRNLKTLIR